MRERAEAILWGVVGNAIYSAITTGAVVVVVSAVVQVALNVPTPVLVGVGVTIGLLVYVGLGAVRAHLAPLLRRGTIASSDERGSSPQQLDRGTSTHVGARNYPGRSSEQGGWDTQAVGTVTNPTDLGTRSYLNASWHGWLRPDQTIKVDGPLCVSDGSLLDVLNSERKIKADEIDAIKPHRDDYFECPMCHEHYSIWKNWPDYSDPFGTMTVALGVGRKLVWATIKEIRQDVRRAFSDELRPRSKAGSET